MFMGKKLPDCYCQKIKENLQYKGFNAKLHFESKRLIHCTLHMSKGTSDFRTIDNFKIANNKWFDQKQSTCSPFNYNTTKLFLESAPHPLKDHRLFLDDFMLMDKVSTIPMSRLKVSSAHEGFKEKMTMTICQRMRGRFKK